MNPFAVDNKDVTFANVIKLLYIKYTKGVDLIEFEECNLYFATMLFSHRYPNEYKQLIEYVLSLENPKEYLESLLLFI